MGKTTEKLKKIPKTILVFFAVALLFLGVGLGTLGSTKGVGDAFELKTKREGGTVPSVVVKLDIGDDYKITDVYVNVAVIYAEAGASATLCMEYGAAESSYSSSRREYAVFENLYTNESLQQEKPTVEGGLFRWVSPYRGLIEKNDDWTQRYSYVRFKAAGKNDEASCDLLINEIVFIGERQEDSKGTGEYAVIPAEIRSATPYGSEETQKEADLRAAALFDEQYIPSAAQSSYYRFSDDELYTLSTIAEMRRGGEYDPSVPQAAYRVEGVYNSLGTDLVILGTEIFGVSPFGLRFMSMLASFGVLVFGFFFVRQLTKNDFAGLVFALLYVFCNLSFALGHLGNPLMIGVFFFVASLCLCHKFYARGIGRARSADIVPLILSALFAAAAIATNGAYLIPVAGVVALFVCGMVRQQRAKRHYLALAAEGGAEGHAETDAGAAETSAPATAEERRAKVAAVEREYREKDVAAVLGFGVVLVVAALLLSLLCAIPLYGPYARLYAAGNDANIFTLAWNAFAGGFVGSDPGAEHAAWDLFYTVYEGSGSMYAVTAVVINAAAAIAGILGIAFAVWRITAVARAGKMEKEQRGELRRVLIPLAGLVLSLVMSSFGGGALGFILLAYVFAFVLAAEGLAFPWGSKYQKAVKIASIVGLVLLVAVFALYSVFTFSVPLSASLMGGIFG